jgi:hypothetical protein
MEAAQAIEAFSGTYSYPEEVQNFFEEQSEEPGAE